MKRKKSERLVSQMSFIDERFVAEAAPTSEKKSRVHSLGRFAALAACLALIVGLGAYLFVPFQPVSSDLSAYRSSEYYPLIEGIESYALSLRNEKTYKNNFDKIVSNIDLDFGLKGDMAPSDDIVMDDAFAPGDTNSGSAESSINGEYQETTDNQVAGVIEADIMKRTDRYIFRLGCKDKNAYYNEKYPALYLNIYEIAGEATSLVCSYKVPTLSGENVLKDCEMYLAEDGSSVTVIKSYIRNDSRSRIGVMRIDLTDVTRPALAECISIDGLYDTSRLMDGKLLLVSKHYFNVKSVDYSDPTTFVPTLDRGNGDEPLKFDDIVYPSEITSACYSVVTLLDSSDLDVLGANGLLNFTNSLYISENRAYLTREYLKGSDEEYVSDVMSEIAVLGLGETLSHERNVNVRGSIADRFCLDEYEGNLRVVTSVEDSIEVAGFGYSYRQNKSASLYVISLSDGSLVASVEEFAPEGDEVASARFDGDELYVCTAVIAQFTDPVYYFDLSDLSSITHKNTGYIDGFSSSLIDLGDGYLLGIGRLDWSYNKVEVWRESVEGVESASSFEFNGDYSSEYKTYFIDREHRMFGFVSSYYYDEKTDKSYSNVFILLQFDGFDLVTVLVEGVESNANDVRSALIGDYLYVTTSHSVNVFKVLSSD